jgi:hypothetical protein
MRNNHKRVEVALGTFVLYAQVDDFLIPKSATKVCLTHDFITFFDAPDTGWHPLVLEQYDNGTPAGLAKWVDEVAALTPSCCRKVA